MEKKLFVVSLVFVKNEMNSTGFSATTRLRSGIIEAVSHFEALGKFYSEEIKKLIGFSLMLDNTVEIPSNSEPTVERSIANEAK